MPDKKLHRRLENLFADRRPVAKDTPPSPAPTPTTEPPAAGAPLLVEDPLQGAEDSGVRERVMEAIRQAQPLTDLRLAVRRQDGQSVYLVTQARPLFDEAGRLSGYQGVTHLAMPAVTPGETRPAETPPVQAVTPGGAPAEAFPIRPEAEVPALDETPPLSAIVAQPPETQPSPAQPGLRLTAAERRAFLDKQRRPSS